MCVCVSISIQLLSYAGPHRGDLMSVLHLHRQVQNHKSQDRMSVFSLLQALETQPPVGEVSRKPKEAVPLLSDLSFFVSSLLVLLPPFSIVLDVFPSTSSA